MLHEKMTNIADAIRRHTNKTEKLSLDDMAVEINRACDHARETGYVEGYESGLTHGKQAEYDLFWDDLQKNGKRDHYYYAFAYHWTDATYNPKYPIDPLNRTGIACMFMSNIYITDTKVPIYVYGNGSQAFSGCTKLKRIPRLIFKELTQVNNMFLNCNALEEVSCEGEITLSLSLAQSTKLNKASIYSFISHLSDTATGQTLTLSQTAVDNAYHDESAEGWGPDEWDDLSQNFKPNWTIALV